MVTEKAPNATGAHEGILEAAEKLFSRYGYAKTAIAEIAAEAGLKKASLYYYFPTKEDLFREVIERKRDVFRKRVDDILLKMSSATDRLNDYIQARFDYFKELQELSIAEFSLAMGNKPLLKEMFERHARQELQWLRLLFDSGKQAGEFRKSSTPQVAAVFLHVLQGLRLRFTREYGVLRPDPPALARFRRELEVLTEIFVDGIRARV